MRGCIGKPRLSPNKEVEEAHAAFRNGGARRRAFYCLVWVGSALAQPKYGPGTSATEIKVGQTIAYSGPASAYGQLGKVEEAYFKWLNAKGGINGRKITFITLDDGYSPPKAVENVRRLVESDQVALVFNVLGTPLNMAIGPT